MRINPATDFCIVWPWPAPKPQADQLYIGTHFLTSVCGFNELAWNTNTQSPPVEEIKKYKVFLVNMFEDQHHVALIRGTVPDAHIIALPDTYFEHALLSDHSRLYLRQLQMADRMAYVSYSNMQFYESLPWSSKKEPFWQIPIPAGPLFRFNKLREGHQVLQSPAQYLLSLDHGQRSVGYSGVQNLLVLLALQEAYNCSVVYVNPLLETQRAADAMGVLDQITFKPYLDYTEYCHLSADATLGVDLYSLHGYGRNELTWALCGLPYIGSSYTDFQGPYNKYEPFDVPGAIKFGKWLLDDYYNSVPRLVQAGVAVASDQANMANCEDRIKRLIEVLEI